MGTVTFSVRDGQGNVTSKTVTVNVTTTVDPMTDPHVYPFTPTSIWKTPIGSTANYDATQFWKGPCRDNLFAEVEIPLSSGSTIDVYTYNKDLLNASGVSAWENFGTSDPSPVKQAVQLQCDPFFKTLKTSLSGKTQSTPNSAGALQIVGTTRIQEGNYFFVRPDASHPYALVGNKLRGTLDMYGDGLEYSRGNLAWGGHGGSMLSGSGGQILVGELSSDPIAKPIRHVLKINGWMKGWGKLAADGTNAYMWPAFQADKPGQPGGYGTAASSYPGTVSLLPMGALVAIPYSVTLTQSMFETVAGFKVAQAAQRFGIYMVDEVGSAAWISYGLCMSWGVVEEMSALGVNVGGKQTGTFPNGFSRDVDKVVSLCRWVKNNSASAVGGGGTAQYQKAPALV